jgi:hypothetical protein
MTGLLLAAAGGCNEGTVGMDKQHRDWLVETRMVEIQVATASIARTSAWSCLGQEAHWSLHAH